MIREICATSDEGLPDETCWRRALNYVTLTAARFQFIRLLVLPVVLHDRCVGEDEATLPEPISVKSVPYVIWSDSTLAAKPNKAAGVKKSPSTTKVPEYLRTAKLHQIVHQVTQCGGQLSDLLKWVQRLAAAGRQSCVFVGVRSFNDFFVGNKVKYHLPDQFFEDWNSLVQVLNSTFPKSVLICGGTSRTWDIQDSVFDIHSARVRERFRQSGILVVNPTDLFDSLPKRALLSLDRRTR